MKKLISLHLLMLILFLVGCDPTGSDEDEPPSIDLEAASITFSIEKDTDFAGTASITGTVKNVDDDFISDPGQQTIYLYEKPLGGSRQAVAQKEFTRLNARDSLKLSYSRDWNASSPAEGEFPPDYILVISYGPDITADGKDTNDDSNNANNELEKSGMGINEMFYD